MAVAGAGIANSLRRTMNTFTNASQVERWSVFELTLRGPQDGNPFVEVSLRADFQYKHRAVEAEGFYDGEGTYKVRFMPDQCGAWTYTTSSNALELDGASGEFQCVPPNPTNHGPVRVAHSHHFAYADNTPYVPVGTTCYVWNHQGDELEEQTLQSLVTAPFNKIRMCVFPKDYDYSKNEPQRHAFEKKLDGTWNYERFNPDFFQHLELRVANLMMLGIEADLILFHPYDRWGYSTMDAETNERYLRYIVARLASYRNIWWSFANEFDILSGIAMQDWDRYFQLVQECDPSQHLRSIHNCRGFYDHGKPWVTHCSIQHSDLSRVSEWIRQYNKPVVVDECCYEGNINHGWGNIPAQELVHRFWEGFARGGYVGHGETYMHPQDILWWSKGGVLHGQSPARIAFLRHIIEQGPAEGLEAQDWYWDAACAALPGKYYLMYFGNRQPLFRDITIPNDKSFIIDLLDTWDMTITRIPGTYSGTCRVHLPGKPYLALRITRVGGE
jgi:hypothetical protein